MKKLAIGFILGFLFFYIALNGIFINRHMANMKCIDMLHAGAPNQKVRTCLKKAWKIERALLGPVYYPAHKFTGR